MSPDINDAVKALKYCPKANLKIFVTSQNSNIRRIGYVVKIKDKSYIFDLGHMIFDLTVLCHKT